MLPPVPSETLRRLVSPPDREMPEGCRLAGAQVEMDEIVARYRCGDELVVLLLEHSSQTAEAAAQTARFSVSFADPAAASSSRDRHLLSVVVRNIVRHEEKIRWIPRGHEEQQHHEVVNVIYAAFLALMLILGFWINLRRHGKGPRGTTPETRGVDRYDAAALGLVILWGASLVYPMLTLPLIGDEASNLEPNFWRTWFLGHESGAHPPLFRFLIHLTARDSEPLWLIRGPSLLFGMGAIFLFFRLARERTSPGAALAFTVALGLSGMHWQWAFIQKSLTLWLCFLLLAHGDLSRALSRQPRRWARYSLWAILACMTHYLSVAYLAGQFIYVVIGRREVWRDHLMALLPATLAVLPLAIPILTAEVGGIGHYDPDYSYLGQLARDVLYWSGVVVALLFLPAGLLSPAARRSETVLLWAACAGFLTTAALAFQVDPAPRYFYPVYPLALLWLAGSLRLRPDRGMWLQILALTAAAYVQLYCTKEIARETYRNAARPAPIDMWLRIISSEDHHGHRVKTLLVAPGFRFGAVFHEVTGRRPKPSTFAGSLRLDSPAGEIKLRLQSLRRRWDTGRLGRLRAREGRFDVLYYASARRALSPEINGWLMTRCKVMAREPTRDKKNARIVLRCGSRPRSSLDIQAAMKSLFSQGGEALP